jgi:hypothetical protein
MAEAQTLRLAIAAAQGHYISGAKTIWSGNDTGEQNRRLHDEHR